MKGEYTPQGLFDLDPKAYISEFMNESEFEYKGLEYKAIRKNANKSWYHKVLIRGEPLIETLDKYLEQDPDYVPIPGRLVNLPGRLVNL